jgi:hypothetical protein
MQKAKVKRQKFIQFHQNAKGKSMPSRKRRLKRKNLFGILNHGG